MKKIIAAKDLTTKEPLLTPSEDENTVIVEIEDEECVCEGCAADSPIGEPGFTEDFVWHPKKKF